MISISGPLDFDAIYEDRAGLRGLPIVVAATGHRDLRSEDVAAVETAVRAVFSRLRSEYSATPLLLMTSLAVGADRLAARIAAEMNIPYRVPMPFEPAEYRKDFNAAEAEEFDRLVAGAEEAYVLPFVGDNDASNVREPDRRAQQYAAVGAYLARVSHVLIALWDGRPADAPGGTAATVGYRLFGAPEPHCNPTGLLDAPDTGPVYHVVTSRRSEAETLLPVGTLRVLTAQGAVDASADPFRRLYERIDQFNRDVRAPDGSPMSATPATTTLRAAAERVATLFQGRYLLAQSIIFTAGLSAGIFLVVAHDAPSLQYIYASIYALLFVIPAIAYGKAQSGRWKDRFVEYRALEMALSVQENWDKIGIDSSVADYYLRFQHSDLDWIRKAARTVHDLDFAIAIDPVAAISAVHEFVLGQRAFFANAGQRERQASRLFRNLSWTALRVDIVLTAVLFCVAVWRLAMGQTDFEAVTPWTPAWFINGDVLVGAIAVILVLAAVLHEYPRRRAFRAQARRYDVMHALYERALRLIEMSGSLPIDERLNLSREVAREIGREALAENAYWVTMHRELPLELLHV